MNKATELFLDYLQQHGGLDAVEAFAEALHEGDETPQRSMGATFRYMGAIHQEFTRFMSEVDLAEAAIELQE
jgi:hypothetical protein